MSLMRLFNSLFVDLHIYLFTYVAIYFYLFTCLINDN